MAGVCRVLVVAAAVVGAHPMVAPPQGFTWHQSHQLLSVGQSQLQQLPPAPPLPTQLFLLLLHWYPVSLPETTTPEATEPPDQQKGTSESWQGGVEGDRQTESLTMTTKTAAKADSGAAVVARAVTDTTTRNKGLLSFINVPDIPCPEGQLRDSAGNCRDVW
ncbi:uncharacterized protein LOC126312625 [Schistocerca gregaria]|uniref:uncharacterized protein LOC126312625 n=1 Tax=Schistocerca gregaria TaxID=7010 RepID=UPI00211DE5C7|nr:uncharacterized protein LOC126312625 [Schistocerca gregaria]